jgi:hypothetical protein
MNTVGIVQYLINKRINSLKDLTSSLIDTKQEKTFKKLQNKKGNRKKEKKSQKKKSTKNLKVEELSSPSLPEISNPKLELIPSEIQIEPISINNLPEMEKEEPIESSHVVDINEKYLSNDLEMKEIPKNDTESNIKTPKINIKEEQEDLKSEVGNKFTSEHSHSSDYSYSVEVDEEDLKELRTMFIRLKIAKFFGSFWFGMFIVIFLYTFVILFHIAIQGVIEVSTKSLCTIDQYPITYLISSLITPLLWFLFLTIDLVLMVVDFVITMRGKPFNLKYYYFIDDPFGFRLEQLIVFIVMLLIYWVAFIPAILYVVNVYSPPAPITSLRGEIISIIQSLILIGIEILIMFALTCVGLIFAILSFIKRKSQKPIYETEFDAFISTKNGIETFKIFAKKEWSMENIQFFEQVEKYKKIRNIKFAEKRAVEIFQNYVEVNSPLEVNLSSDVRKQTKTKVNHFQEYKEGYRNIFDDAIKETKRNMRDTFSRIVKTKEFNQWKSSTKVLIETSK